MNILFLAEFKITGNTGGVGRVTKTLTEGLEKKGHVVYYYAMDKIPADPGDKARQFYCSNPRKILDESNVAQLKQLLYDLSINLVINQSGFRSPAIELLKRACPRDVVVFTVHHNCIRCMYDNYQQIISNNFNIRPWFRLIDNNVFWWVLRSFFRQKFARVIQNVVQFSDRVVLLAPMFQKEISFFVPRLSSSKKITAIYNPAPFEVNAGALNMKQNRLLFIGVLKKTQKRADRLVEIWDRLSRLHPDWHLDILGDGPERMQIEESFQQLGTERYTFHGFTDPQPFLETAKFFLLTSDYEGFGMVLLESQSYGVIPVVFDKISMVNELVHDKKNALVIPSYDVAQYIERLSAHMLDENARLQMATECQQHISKFHLDTIAGQWESLYEIAKKEKQGYEA